MAKERWRKCPVCQIYTDVDEKHCPLYGAEKEHKLKTVWLGKEEIKKLIKEKKIWTKHIIRFQKLAKRKRPAQTKQAFFLFRFFYDFFENLRMILN